MTLPAPALKHVFDLAVTVSPPVDVGMTARGLRRMIPITGGTVKLSAELALRYYGHESLEGFHGQVIPGGADFQLVLSGGMAAHLDARYVIEMSGGVRIFVFNTALRVASAETSARLMRGEPVDPSEVYFRCQPQFDVADPQWDWLQKHQFIGSGMRRPDGVYLSFFQVL